MFSIRRLAGLIFAVATVSAAVAEEAKDGAAQPAIENDGRAAESEAGAESTASTAAASVGEEKQVAAAEDPDKKVCKYIATPGSRLGRKTCMTKAEWERIREDSREAVDKLQRQNTAPGLPQG